MQFVHKKVDNSKNVFFLSPWWVKIQTSVNSMLQFEVVIFLSTFFFEEPTFSVNMAFSISFKNKFKHHEPKLHFDSQLW